MASEAWSPLERLAAAHGDPITDSWERSFVTIRGDVQMEELEAAARCPGLTVQLLYGDDDLPLTLRSDQTPSPDELNDLRVLLDNEREQAELVAATSTSNAATLLQPHRSGTFVQYAKAGWVRTEAALLAAVDRNWVDVASTLPTEYLSCGSGEIEMEVIDALDPPGALKTIVPKAGQALAEPVAQRLAALADAAAWTQLAVRSTVTDRCLLVALHHDQDPTIEVTPTTASGGLELLRWRLGDSQSNREEALRHVLRLVTASAATLPNALTVRTLSQRQFLALSRDRAAEVVRAISEAQRTTADVLAKATESLSTLVEDTTTTASATVAAVIGVVALVVQNGTLVPGWIILLATVVAVGGVLAVVASRWRRIQDQVDAIGAQEQRLDNDPLLPEDERESIAKLLEDADVAKRARTTRQRIVALGATAGTVALIAAIWLVARPATNTGEPSTPTSTTTTSPISTQQPRP